MFGAPNGQQRGGTTKRERTPLPRLAAIALLAAAVPASAMAIVFDGDEAPVIPQGGFQLPKEEDSFNTSLEDFQRYRDKKQWDAAFRVLTTLGETPRKGFTPTEEGFLVPSSERIRDAVMTLPADGREAYRLFNDAKAKQLFEEATQARSRGPASDKAWDEIAPLQQIVNTLFLTSYGDRAADRLGDAFFESGNFGAAAEQWRSVLSKYPDSQLSPLRLHVKSAIAYARAGRSDAVTEIERTIQEKFEGQTVDLGGKPQDALAFVRSLRSTAAAPQAGTTTADLPAQVMPASEKELWQTVFVDDAVVTISRNRLTQMGWISMVDPIGGAVPPTAIDEKRVYVNWIGITFAIELASGKLVWWSTPLGEVAKRAQQLTEQASLDADRFALTLLGGRLYATGVLPPTNNTNDPTRLVCYDPESGKQHWTTQTTSGEYSYIGEPILFGDSVLAAATKQNQAELELHAIDPAKGTRRWSMTLGTSVSMQSFRGNGRVPPPVLRAHGGMLYVLTNCGALLAVNVDRKQVEWALRTETLVQGQDPRRGGFISSRYSSKEIKPPGQLIVEGGLMYVKENRSNKLYAIDPAARRLVWRRPLASEETIAGLYEGQILTVGTDVGAIDAQSRRLKWSTRLPVQHDALRPLIGRGQMVIFCSRGLYQVSTETGDVTKILRGADTNAIGGVVTLTAGGDKLITISNRAVTAYALPAPGEAPNAARPVGGR